MMRLSAEIRPVNSIVFVHGEPTEGWPLPIWGAQILATNSAVSVTCMPEVDGSTILVFGDMRDVGLDRTPDYEGILRASGDELFITTVEGHILLRMPAEELSTLKIWRSHPLWPENVTIGIEAVPDRWQAERRMLPTDQTTVTTISMPDLVSSIFLSDGTVPRQHRDFNPWQNPDFLRSGLLLKIGKPIHLTVATDIPKNFVRPPDIDVNLETPSREIQIFDSQRERALLKIDVPKSRTRVCAWIESGVAVYQLTIIFAGA